MVSARLPTSGSILELASAVVSLGKTLNAYFPEEPSSLPDVAAQFNRRLQTEPIKGYLNKSVGMVEIREVPGSYAEEEDPWIHFI